MHPARDHSLPPDPAAYRAARHPRGRVIVIAPTRAACETIELALGRPGRHRAGAGARRRPCTPGPRPGTAFGIVAGTGTGKTLAIRPIAEAILQESLRYGVVNREREATPETPTLERGHRHHRDRPTLVPGRPDHRAGHAWSWTRSTRPPPSWSSAWRSASGPGCRFIWLSATVDPAFYAKYLESREVLETTAFDPALAATVRVVPKDPEEFLDDKVVRRILRDRRGVAVFVPTRAEVERLARDLGDQWPKLNAAFYHGGEPIRVIRPFLEGEVEKPFLLGDDRGGPVGAQPAGPRHGGDLRRALRQRGGPRTQRAPPAVPGRQRDPPDGGPGARPGRQGRGDDPERPAARLRGAAADPAGVPAGRRRRAGGDHLRRDRRRCHGSRPAGAARQGGLPAGGARC